MKSTAAQRLFQARKATETVADTLERMALDCVAFDADGYRLWDEAHTIALQYGLYDVVRRLERIMNTAPRSDAGRLLTRGGTAQHAAAKGAFNALFVVR